ncbi:RM36 protein, partial [Rhinopomastus cyanomelas]|nr:RM36 protein [Rhinopomastus cyanomelas]
MLCFLARAAAPLRSLGRSPLSAFSTLSSLAPRWPWSSAAPPRGLLAVPPPPAWSLLPAGVAGLKSKTLLRKRCKDCFFVRRRGRLYIYCKTNPRHKQRKL